MRLSIVAVLGACASDPTTTDHSGAPVDGDTDTPVDTDSNAAGDGLRVVGNQILLPDDLPFRGRGANLQDTRSCWACAWESADAGEVERRADELIDGWGANFVRLTLQADAYAQPYQVQWQGVVDDPDYLADVVDIVRHMTDKPGVYVLLSEWSDPTFSEYGWPTARTNDEWALLAETFLWDDKVLFGLCNEPQYNFDHALDPDVWDAMNAAV